MRTRIPIILALPLTIVAVNRAWPAGPESPVEAQKSRILVGRHLEWLAESIQAGSITIQDVDLQREILAIGTPSGTRVSALSLPPVGVSQPPSYLVLKCTQGSTLFESGSTVQADYEALREYARMPLVAFAMGPSKPPGQETVSTLEMVTPSTVREETVPAVYEERTHQVCVMEERCCVERVPATYETVSEQVCVAQARTEWRRVPCKPEGLGGGQVIECWTLVEVPAQFETQSRVVCVTPASTRAIPRPAEYATVTEHVEVQAARTERVRVPPVFAMRRKAVQVSGGRRRAAIRLGSEFGELRGLYFLPRTNERSPDKESVAQWDSGKATPATPPWINLMSRPPDGDAWSELQGDGPVHGTLYALGSNGAWGPQDVALEATHTLVIEKPERNIK